MHAEQLLDCMGMIDDTLVAGAAEKPQAKKAFAKQQSSLPPLQIS